MATANNNHPVRNRIFNVIASLKLLPKVAVEQEDSHRSLFVTHPHKFMPDFSFRWCDSMQHYRVYIHVGSAEYDKVCSGYNICTVRSSLIASGFVILYQFIHRNRANQKSTTEA